jgi:CubicO group peptidase (beta-lactamase class C family)
MDGLVSGFLVADPAMVRACELNFQPVPQYDSVKLVAAVVQNGNTTSLSCRGGANEKTLFRIASMTKSFVACAVLILRDREMLDLTDHVSKHVPQLSSLQKEATLFRFLTMSFGLPTDDPWADRLMDCDEQRFLQILSSVSSPCIEPGSSVEYSNLSYGILGRVISNVSKMSFQQFILQEILIPLGMRDTVWQVDASSNWAAPCDGAPVLKDGHFASLGGLFSNVADLKIWARFLSCFGEFASSGPLSAASRRGKTKRKKRFFVCFEIFSNKRNVSCSARCCSHSPLFICWNTG